MREIEIISFFFLNWILLPPSSMSHLPTVFLRFGPWIPAVSSRFNLRIAISATIWGFWSRWQPDQLEIYLWSEGEGGGNYRRTRMGEGKGQEDRVVGRRGTEGGWRAEGIQKKKGLLWSPSRAEILGIRRTEWALPIHKIWCLS